MDKGRIEGYIEEFTRQANEMLPDAFTDASQKMMRVVPNTRFGKALILFLFYRDTVHINIMHPVRVNERQKSMIAGRFDELNSCLDVEMAYGVGKDSELFFAAMYDMKRSVASDHGIDGLCELIFKTAIQRLDKIADMVAGQEPQSFFSIPIPSHIKLNPSNQTKAQSSEN